MTLLELQDILGSRIEIALMDLPTEERKIENEQSAVVVGIAKEMIHNGNLILQAEKFASGSKNKKLSSAKLITG